MSNSSHPHTLARRSFLRASAIGAAAPAIVGLGRADAAEEEARNDGERIGVESGLEERTIAELQAFMASGQLTSKRLTRAYLNRIRALDVRGPKLNSVLELNPNALDVARALDVERQGGTIRGPLHGIPILLKDNIDTADMTTTAGSLGLQGSIPLQDATVTARLRAAGAVILGKLNLSEWANFRAFNSSSGWSGLGGQTKNPYILDRNPCGSSSGSGAAVSANLAAAALATETDGSIVCPAHNCGVVGIKPTVGLTSRAGVIPISHSQDTVGPHGRTVADAAAVLGALTGVDPRDPATADSAGHSFTDYTQFLDDNGLSGMRIGVPRIAFTGYSTEADALFEAALNAMRDAGATVVDPADFLNADELFSSGAEFTVLLFEFKQDLNAYLASLRPGFPRTLAEMIAFNEANAERELPFFGQEIFTIAEGTTDLNDPVYLAALAESRRISREEGIDRLMDEFDLDAFVAPTGSPAWTTDLVNGDLFLGASSGPAAQAGYPIITVPMGFSFGLPVGLSIMGRAWSEPTLVKIASGFEAATGHRRKPRFIPSLAAALDHGAHSARERSRIRTTPTPLAGGRRRLLL